MQLHGQPRIVVLRKTGQRIERERRMIGRVMRLMHEPLEARDVGQIRQLARGRKRRQEIREMPAQFVEVAARGRVRSAIRVREARKKFIADELADDRVDGSERADGVGGDVGAIHREAPPREYGIAGDERHRMFIVRAIGHRRAE